MIHSSFSTLLLILNLVSFELHAENLREVRVPGSDYFIQVPNNWTDHKIYDIKPPINSNALHPISDNPFLQLNFLFMAAESTDNEFKKLEERITNDFDFYHEVKDVELNGIYAKTFSYSTKVIRDYRGSETEPSTQVSETTSIQIWVGLSDGILKCELKGRKEELVSFKDQLINICKSTIKLSAG